MARVTKTASIQEFHPQSRTDEEESQQEQSRAGQLGMQGIEVTYNDESIQS